MYFVTILHFEKNMFYLPLSNFRISLPLLTLIGSITVSLAEKIVTRAKTIFTEKRNLKK